jgi:predicted NBD/HSP70 family sugar kinase
LRPARTGAEGSAIPGRRRGRPRVVDVGQASLAAVFSIVRDGLASTRAAVEEMTGFSRAVVVERLATLESLGLLAPGDLAASTGGRAARTLRFRVEAGVILLAVIDRSSLAIGLADLDGVIQMEHHESLDVGAGAEALLDRLTMLFGWLGEEHGGNNAVWAIGLAVSGAAAADLGAPADGASFASDPTDPWSPGDLASELTVRFGAPVWARSATQMMTMGELLAGTGVGIRDLLFVNLSRSVTAGVVSNGRLHRGAHGAAGLIGHAPTGEESDVPCRCGNRGCLESLVGGDAIAREGAKAAADGRSPYLAEVLRRGDPIAAADVGLGAQFGDAFCAEFTSRCGRLVGAGLAPLVNVLNPALVVLGGSVAQSGDVLLAAVRESIYRLSNPQATRELRILRSQMGGTVGLMGAGRMVADALFERELLQDWIAQGSPRRLACVQAHIEASRAARRRSPPLPSGGQAAVS